MKNSFPHILQTPAWGRAKRAASPAWTPFFFARPHGAAAFAPVETIGDPAAIESSVLVLERELGFRQRLHYVPRGPWVDWADAAAVGETLEFLREFGRERGILFTRLEPDAYALDFDGSRLANAGFRRTPDYIQAKDTVKVRIDKNDDELLGSFHHKHRYNIRLAEKRGLTVRSSTQASDARLFYELLKKTEGRHGGALHIHPLSYYEKVLAVLAAEGLARVYLVEKDGALASASLVFTYGAEAIYMFGASDYEHRRDMPNHLREWRSMCDARDEGRLWFDLWGVTMRNDPGGGIKRYKLGYSERVENMAGTFDWSPRPLAYAAFTALNRIRRGPDASG
ncbi:MAG: peptidoglycan bridge formation glycyltransferase FemA/FemB family protein [Spirochaetales bacterium]|nr:peptidoglycan bridge formation glycyltransferase FemA/FemB family protein [Spirochaetales bacterium]